MPAVSATLAIVGQQIIAQGLQVAVVVRTAAAGSAVEHAVGVVLVLEAAGRQLGDRLPIGHLEPAVGGMVIRQSR